MLAAYDNRDEVVDMVADMVSTFHPDAARADHTPAPASRPLDIGEDQ